LLARHEFLDVERREIVADVLRILEVVPQITELGAEGCAGKDAEQQIGNFLPVGKATERDGVAHRSAEGQHGPLVERRLDVPSPPISA